MSSCLHSIFSSLLLFLLISTHSLLLSCLLCSPFNHRISPRSSNHLWTFEITSLEIETKINSVPASTGPIPWRQYCWLYLGHMITLEPMTLGRAIQNQDWPDQPICAHTFGREYRTNWYWQSHQNHLEWGAAQRGAEQTAICTLKVKQTLYLMDL